MNKEDPKEREEVAKLLANTLTEQNPSGRLELMFRTVEGMVTLLGFPPGYLEKLCAKIRSDLDRVKNGEVKDDQLKAIKLLMMDKIEAAIGEQLLFIQSFLEIKPMLEKSLREKGLRIPRDEGAISLTSEGIEHWLKIGLEPCKPNIPMVPPGIPFTNLFERGKKMPEAN